jgi:hypothetical protein
VAALQDSVNWTETDPLNFILGSLSYPGTVLPNSPIDTRNCVGKFNARRLATPPTFTPRRGQPLRLDSPIKVGMMLMCITSAANVRAAPLPAPQRTATAAPGSAGCVTFAPLSVPTVLHGVSNLLRNPFELARDIYYRVEGNGCNPPESPAEEALLKAADVAIDLFEATLLGPEATMVKQAAADGFDVVADTLDGKPLSRALLEDTVLSLAGMKTGRLEQPKIAPPRLTQLPPPEPGSSSISIFGRAVQAITRRPALDTGRVEIGAPDREGVYPYRDTVSGREGRAFKVNGEYFRLQAFSAEGAHVEGVRLHFQDGRYRLIPETPVEEAPATNEELEEPAETDRVRCARSPGAACSGTDRPGFSTELTKILRQHHRRGIEESVAEGRGIKPDPDRPGWYIKGSGTNRREYVLFEERLFPVRRHTFGGCTRMTLRVPKFGLMSSMEVATIAHSPASSGPRLITQTEYNVGFRDFASEDASHAYEHAVRTAPDVDLEQSDQAAILRYFGQEEAALEGYLQGDPLPLHRGKELKAYADALDGALSRLPVYRGPVYRGAVLPTAVLEGLTVGTKVRIRAFVRASGDRDMALRQLEGRTLRDDQTPVVVELQAPRSHAVGLWTMRDEAEVITPRGKLYEVARKSTGELVLKKPDNRLPTFGQPDPVDLRLG